MRIQNKLDVFGSRISSATRAALRLISGWLEFFQGGAGLSGWALAMPVPGSGIRLRGFPSVVPPVGIAMAITEPSAGLGVNGESAAGAEDSISELYRKYSQPIYWVCMRYTRNSEDAEDMVHQVFVKVSGGLAGFRGQSNVYTWMYRIAVNECIQMIRKRKFEVDEGALPDLENMVQVSPESEMNAKILLERIMKATDPETAEILFMLHLEGLNQEEAAEALNISRSTLNRKMSSFKSKMGRFRW